MGGGLIAGDRTLAALPAAEPLLAQAGLLALQRWTHARPARSDQHGRFRRGEEVAIAKLGWGFAKELGAAPWAGKCEPRSVEDEAGIARPPRWVDAGAPAKVFDLCGEKCVRDLPVAELRRQAWGTDSNGRKELGARGD